MKSATRADRVPAVRCSQEKIADPQRDGARGARGKPHEPEERRVQDDGERARAWLVTAINPILRALPIEESYVARRAWTWRFHLGRFELLQPVSEMVSSICLSNLDDVLEKTPDLAKLVRDHDQKLERLRSHLAQAQSVIESDPELVRQIDEALREHKTAHPTDRPTGALEESKLPSLVAQLVLNNITELNRSDSTMSEFWADHGALLRRASEAKFGAEIKRVDQGGAALHKAVRSLAETLRKLRMKLCDKHGLPPMPLAGDIQVSSPEVF